MDLRKVIAAGAVLTCAAASGVAIGGRAPDRDSAALTVADAPSSPSSASASPSASASAAPPGPTATPEPTRLPPSPPSWPTTKPTPGPVPTTSPPAVVPTSPPAPLTSWRAEARGATLDVRISRAVTPTASLVDFEIDANSGGWLVNQIQFLFGDGTGHQVTDPPLNACGTQGEQHRRVRQTVPHAYRAPGVHRFEVHLYAAPTTTCQTFEHVDVVVRGTILVTPGPMPGNGPSPVTVEFGNQIGSPRIPPGHIGFEGAGYDADGWIPEMSLDWGDGSPATVVRFDPKYCVEDPRRWLPTRAPTQMLTHKYAAPGPYTATFRVVSSGCDGRDPQEISVKVPMHG